MWVGCHPLNWPEFVKEMFDVHLSNWIRNNSGAVGEGKCCNAILESRICRYPSTHVHNMQPSWLDEQLSRTRTRICLCAHPFRVMEINSVAICAACAAAVHLIISEYFMGMSRDEDVGKDRDCILSGAVAFYWGTIGCAAAYRSATADYLFYGRVLRAFV